MIKIKLSIVKRKKKSDREKSKRMNPGKIKLVYWVLT